MKIYIYFTFAQQFCLDHEQNDLVVVVVGYFEHIYRAKRSHGDILR
jgi:hypothetical protein